MKTNTILPIITSSSASLLSCFLIFIDIPSLSAYASLLKIRMKRNKINNIRVPVLLTTSDGEFNDIKPKKRTTNNRTKYIVIVLFVVFIIQNYI